MTGVVEMGRVVTKAVIENAGDLIEFERGMRQRDQVRQLIVPDALVDTGATTLALPTRMIQKLGLTKAYEKRGLSSRGTSIVNIYGPVRLTLLEDRFCTVDVMEVPDEVPVLIGQIPLEMLDLVVDLQGRKITGNPAHGGEQMLELY